MPREELATKALASKLESAPGVSHAYWNLRGNGGLLSTVGDLYKWHQALLGDAVLSKGVKEKYFVPHVAEDPSGSSHYGYGWVIEKTPRGTSSITHNVGNCVFAADFQRYVDEGAAIIAGSAQSNFQCFSVSVAVHELVFGGEIRTPLEMASVDAEALQRYAGN
jgi:CubicO group peptidase (beta-lactamase class C family)